MANPSSSSPSKAPAQALILNSFQLITIHNALQIVGFFLLAFVLSTALLSRRVHRSPNWYLFMSLWLFWCIVYFLLVGQQVKNVEPTHGICLFQAVLVNTTGASNSFSILCISLEVCLTVASSLRQRAYSNQRVINILIFSLPLIMFIVTFIWHLAVALGDQQNIKRRPSGVYCVLDKNRFSGYLTLVTYMLPLGAVLIVEVVTYILLYRYWARSRVEGGQFGHSKAVPLTLVFRVLIFGLLPVIPIVVMVIRMKEKGGMSNRQDDPVPIILPDCLPIAAALVFGSQKDILSVWTCRRHEDPEKSSGTVSNSHA